MMKRLSRPVALLAILLSFALPAVARAQSSAHVDVLTIEGQINLSTSSYVDRGIGVAEQDGAQAVVLLLNTPGGSLDAMQNITSRMLNARVPTIVFVYPKGAWAGSAGTFITLAGNIAAMAPGTTIGAAHPVDASGQDISGDERDKITNFSVGIIKNIAQARGRNAQWAANAVQSSVAATAQEALDQHVIDLMATDVNDLLNKVDGKTVTTAAGTLTLKTQRVGVNTLDMNIAEIFLHLIVDPNIAAILLNIGLLAIAVELYNPGATIPALTGGLCLVLAFIGLYNLAANWAGVILIVLSVIAFFVDVKITSVVLTAGALLLFVVGALLLFTPMTPPSPAAPDFFNRVSVSPIVIVVMGGFMAVFFLVLLGAVVRSHNFPVLSGKESLIGATGTALSDLAPSGIAYVKGEDWSAEAHEGAIQKGEQVQVVAVEGLRLKVIKK